MCHWQRSLRGYLWANGLFTRYAGTRVRWWQNGGRRGKESRRVDWGWNEENKYICEFKIARIDMCTTSIYYATFRFVRHANINIQCAIYTTQAPHN